MEQKLEKMSIWGWGLESFEVSQSFFQSVTKGFQLLGLEISSVPHPLPNLESIQLPNPRFSLPKNLQDYCISSNRMRLRHTYGKSTRELIKALNGLFENVPDYIAFPKSEHQISEILSFCSENNVAAVPFGGGSSVVGGINLHNPRKYQGTIVINLLHLNKLLFIDKINQTATFEGGIYGPDLEKALSDHHFTFRNYPQSFEFSTLGGWLATHSGGHFATGRTHIDSAVQNLRIITPSGPIETRKTPPDGAGPYHNPLFLGSEGIFGIITQATIRILRPAVHRIGHKVSFASLQDAVNALREIVQSGIEPANCRIFDPVESFGMGIGKGGEAIMLLAFESAGIDNLAELMKYCLVICGKFNGKKIAEGKDEKTGDGDFRNNFTSAPYLRNELLRRGVLVETLETVVKWSEFEAFHEKMTETLFKKVEELCGKGVVTCRITHCYTDGLAPYYTIIGQMGELKHAVEKWDKIKDAANKTLVEMGASVTHHHAVGRDHGEGFRELTGEKILGVIRKIKEVLDPKGIMNPEILI